MVKDDPVGTARHLRAVVQEADRLACHLPPETIRQIEASDPSTQIEMLVGSAMFLPKSARRQIVDTLDWLVSVARERGAESGEHPALRVVRVSAP